MPPRISIFSRKPRKETRVQSDRPKRHHVSVHLYHLPWIAFANRTPATSFTTSNPTSSLNHPKQEFFANRKMDGKHSCRNSDDDDVDHYFLPGGILDPPPEEDMIGESLLDEIGAVGNVTPSRVKPNSVSRVIGSETRTEDLTAQKAVMGAEGDEELTGIADGGPTRLSVEGTNPMAKEFTPSSIPSDAAIEASRGAHLKHAKHSASNTPAPKRVFSAAVGSEVKAADSKPYQATMMRPARKLPGPPGSALPSQHAVRAATGQQAHISTHHSGAPWPRRESSPPVHLGRDFPPNDRRTRVKQEGQSVSSRGAIPQTGSLPRCQGTGISPMRSQRREFTASGNHRSNPGHYADQTRDQSWRVAFPKAGAQSALGSRGGRSQRKTRNQMPLGQTNSLEENRSGERSTVQLSVDAEHDRDPDRGHGIWVQESGEQGMIGGAPCPRSRRSRSSGRASDGAIDTSGQDTLTSGSRQEGALINRTKERTVDMRTKAGPGYLSHRTTSPSFLVSPSQKALSQQPSSRSSSAGSQPTSTAAGDASEESLVALATGHHGCQPLESWRSSDGLRGSHQYAEDDIASQGQSHASKEKDKERARPRKKEEKLCRASTKHSLGSAAKEAARVKGDIRSSVSQRAGMLSAYLRGLSLGISAAVLQAIVGQINRLRVVGRVIAVLSFTASSSASFLTVVIMSISWLSLQGLRVHSLALKEATGSVHVAVCFLFPYCFQYLVSLIDEWAPHWLPACLWYSFLMQMFCTSNHLHKHSASSHLVPALRALLPVVFLCEVPSGRSYLLDLGGSELLLLSFTLAAVRLRCFFSPVFLFSWSSQVLAIATCGSSAALQYGQLLASLASLHAVSMVDMMINSRSYHARYRASMSLTNGFKVITPPSRALMT